MSNKNYFKSISSTQPLDLKFYPISGFNVGFGCSFDCSDISNLKPRSDSFHFSVYNLNGDHLLSGSIVLTKRAIHTDIYYPLSKVSLCKYYPYELREWCPAIFVPFTNYHDWKKYFPLALDIFKSKNPKLV